MAEVKPDIAVYKILTPPEREVLRASGTFEGSAVDRADGFIHFSRMGQVAETLDRHFGDHESVHLLEVATSGLIDFLRWEESRGGELFPHLYGSFGADDVRREWTLERRSGWQLPPDL